jgi:uncharacterized protein (DUF302 family)
MNNSTRYLRNTLVALAVGMLAVGPAWAVSADKNKPKIVHMVGQTILEMPLADGVSMDDAADSLKQRANTLNFKLVAELPLSEQVAAMTGKPQKRMTIYEFCDPMTAQKMVTANAAFAAFLPCRIALVEGKDGKAMLVMIGLDDLIKAARLSPELKPLAKDVRDKLMDILKAGANGEL